MNAPGTEEPGEILGGLSLGTVLFFKHAKDDEFAVTHSSPNGDGRFAGWLVTLEGDPLINTRPIFESSEAAEAHVRKVVEACRNFKTMTPRTGQAWIRQTSDESPAPSVE